MTWSYNPALSTNLDRVRFLIGDTNTNDQLLANEEITWILTQQSDVYSAAAFACRGLQAKYARKATKSVGDLSIQWAEIANNFRDLHRELTALASRFGMVPTPYVGGISMSDKDFEEQDTDRAEPYYRVGLHDYNLTPPERQVTSWTDD